MKKNILIYPHINTFNIDDGGIVVQYYLAQLLDKCGENVRIMTSNHVDNIIFTKYFTEIDSKTWTNNNTIVVYCEGVQGNPLNAIYIARWILSELGINVDKNILDTWNKNELVYFFNSELRIIKQPEKINKIFKYLTAYYLHPSIINLNLPIRNGTCYTIRKALHMCEGLKQLHSISDFEINRNHSQTEIIQIFNKHLIFISYDPLTFLTIMAALCGCISVVHPYKEMSKLEWMNTTAVAEYISFKKIDNLYGIAYGTEEIEYAKSTLHLVKEQWDDIKKYYTERHVKSFIEDINNFEKMENTIENVYLK